MDSQEFPPSWPQKGKPICSIVFELPGFIAHPQHIQRNNSHERLGTPEISLILKRKRPEQRAVHPGYLMYIWDEILLSYIEIIIIKPL